MRTDPYRSAEHSTITVVCSPRLHDRATQGAKRLGYGSIEEHIQATLTNAYTSRPKSRRGRLVGLLRRLHRAWRQQVDGDSPVFALLMIAFGFGMLFLYRWLWPQPLWPFTEVWP